MTCCTREREREMKRSSFLCFVFGLVEVSVVGGSRVFFSEMNQNIKKKERKESFELVEL